MTDKKIEEILSSTADKNQSNIKLLISDSDFSELIHKTRDDLDISPGGFDDDKDIKKWENELLQKSDKILSNKLFIEKEVLLKKQLKKSGESYTESIKKLNKLYDEIPINYLKNRIDFIVDKFNLPLNYNRFLRSYIITGETINVPCQNFTIGEYPPFVKPEESNFIPVKIFSRLTNDEIELLKYELSQVSKQLPKYQPLKNVDRDLEIEEWMANRKKFDPVEYESYTMPTSEVAENLLGNSKEVKGVHDILKDLKKIRKKRFKSSGKT